MSGGMAKHPHWLSFALQQEGRFWSHVDKTGDCWVWTGCTDKDGYGTFSVTLPRVKGKQQQCKVRAHRLAYMLKHGHIESSVLILHSCDNPPCCNPAHLEAGTQKKNRVDAKARGRVPRGEHHHRAKLTEAQALEILRLRRSGASPRRIARDFGIAEATVYQIGKQNWRHLKDAS